MIVMIDHFGNTWTADLDKINWLFVKWQNIEQYFQESLAVIFIANKIYV